MLLLPCLYWLSQYICKQCNTSLIWCFGWHASGRGVGFRHNMYLGLLFADTVFSLIAFIKNAKIQLQKAAAKDSSLWVDQSQVIYHSLCYSVNVISRRSYDVENTLNVPVQCMVAKFIQLLHLNPVQAPCLDELYWIEGCFADVGTRGLAWRGKDWHRMGKHWASHITRGWTVSFEYWLFSGLLIALHKAIDWGL